MPQIIVNPDDQRRFANHLDALRESLRERKFNTLHAFEHLRQSWKDEKYNQFEKTLNSTSQDLDHFLKTLEVYANFLRAKAAKADRYLGRS